MRIRDGLLGSLSDWERVCCSHLSLRGTHGDSRSASCSLVLHSERKEEKKLKKNKQREKNLYLSQEEKEMKEEKDA